MKWIEERVSSEHYLTRMIHMAFNIVLHLKDYFSLRRRDLDLRLLIIHLQLLQEKHKRRLSQSRIID